MHVPVGLDVVLRVLGGQEACELGDGGAEAAADVPPRRRLLLGDEHLSVAEVVDVDHRDGAGHRADEFQPADPFLVA